LPAVTTLNLRPTRESQQLITSKQNGTHGAVIKIAELFILTPLLFVILGPICTDRGAGFVDRHNSVIPQLDTVLDVVESLIGVSISQAGNPRFVRFCRHELHKAIAILDRVRGNGTGIPAPEFARNGTVRFSQIVSACDQKTIVLKKEIKERKRAKISTGEQ
jgi:hypothetical protein